MSIPLLKTSSLLLAVSGLALVMAAGVSSCQPEKKQGVNRQANEKRLKLIRRIDSLETAMKKMGPQTTEDEVIFLGMTIAKSCQEYSVSYGNDSLAPEYLTKLATIYDRVLKDPSGASQYYDQVIKRYPDYRRLDEVYFLMANLLVDNNMPDKAKPYLERLLENWPDSPYLQDANALLTIVNQDGGDAEKTISRFKKGGTDSTKRKPA